MKRSWTEEQKQAMELNHRNLLVAAAAGSGKTAVLIERILGKLLDPQEPVDVDRLLVVTFTRAAASEMKERLRNALLARAEEEPNNEHIRRQLPLLNYADITTIDSFCLQVVQNYCQEIDLDPAFRVGDEGELKLLFSDTMEAFLERQYREGDERFFRFVESYASGKNDKVLEDCLEQLYRFSQSYPWPAEWFASCRQSFEAEETELEQQPWIRFLEEQLRFQARELCEMLTQALSLALGPAGPYMYESALRTDLDMAKRVAGQDRFFEMCQVLASYAPARLSSQKDADVDPELREQVKSLRDLCKKQLQARQKEYGSLSAERILEDLQALKEPMQTALSLAEKLGQEYDRAKKEKNILDFSDVEHLALDILVERRDGESFLTPAALELQTRYEEVMVDEYQDESRLQEEILTSVSRLSQGTPNLFMVGDVKQSIYKFRLARPELFLEKYKSYSSEDSLYQKIDLRKNFRSRKEPVEWINSLFYQIMQEPVGGVAYNDEAALYPGAVYPQAEGKGGMLKDYQPELFLLDGGLLEEEKLSSEEGSIAEWQTIASCIHMMMDPEDPLLVRGEDGGLRPVEFGDIAILMRSGVGKSEQLVSTLLQSNIPAAAQTRKGYFSAWEVQIVLNWLRILDNPSQDIPLASVLHSPSAGFTAEELARITAAYQETGLREQKPRLYQALLSYRKEDPLGDKVRGFLELFGCLRRLSRTLSIHELLQELFDRTGFYDQVSVMHGGRVRRGNLDMLLEKAISYENLSYHGLFQFVRYIDKLDQYQVDYQEAAETAAAKNQVQIMTIHASKGLEFPVVFVAGLQKLFNDMDNRKQILLHPDWGISADLVDPERRLRKKTLMRQAFARRGRIDNLGEELRVLYVALTRAKEKLILTGFSKDAEGRLSKWEGIGALKEEAIPASYLLSASSYLDWILMGQARGEKGLRTHIWSPEELLPELGIQEEKELELRKKLEKLGSLSGKLADRIDAELHYVYPYEAETHLPTKLSVSELKKQWMEEQGEELPAVKILEKEESSEEAQKEPSLPIFMKEAEPLKGASRGTAYHTLLEHWPYGEAAEEESVSAQVQALEEKGILSRKEAESISPQAVVAFLQSSLGRRMVQAAARGQLYREKQFVMGIPASEGVPGCSSSELLVVQGIIDAWMEEPEGLVIIDYKTDRVPYRGGEELLRSRYSAQLRYYEKALSRITGKPVKEKIIYSFCLNREIVVS